MINKINGDFDTDSIEAFRSAYASRILSPEDQEVDERTGLPTDVVLNTSPWIQHTGLWKANDGTDKNFIPNQILVPGFEEEMSDEELDALIQEALSEGEGEIDEEDIEEIDEEEVDRLIQQVLDEQELDEAIQELLEEDGFDEEDEELRNILEDSLSEGVDEPIESEEDEEVDEEEIEALLEEILNDIGDEDTSESEYEDE